MVVQQIQVQEVGEDGSLQERTLETRSVGFFITIEGEQFKPAIVREVEIETDSDVSAPKDQCGNVEREKTSNEGWSARVTGIVTANDDRPGNLSMQLMRDYVAKADSVEVRGDLFPSGGMTIVVSNVVITQSSDLVSVNTKQTNGAELAFDFQLQLGEKNSQE